MDDLISLIRKQKSLTNIGRPPTMLLKWITDVLETEDAKYATDPIHFEEALAFSVPCYCRRLGHIG
jgi:hypothetical protein